MTRALAALLIAAVVAFSLRRGIFLIAALARPRPLPAPGPLPTACVLVPARNERPVAEALLGALARLDYPPDRLRFVLVCDGCSDDTPALFRAWAAARADARVVELPESRGKAAALNAGLAEAEAEIVAVIDADLRPAPSFLRELAPAFADARVAAAAAYLRPANADENLVTRYAAVTTWVHQLMTSAATDRLGLNPPTLGAAAFRRAALAEIGGFPAAPAGVDVATSAALTQRGWRTRFVARAVADNTVVASASDYWRQHVRWSRAVFRLPRAGAPRAGSWAQRIESVAASIGYADRLVFAAALLAAAAGRLPVWVPLLYLAAPGLEIVAAVWKAGVRGRMLRFLVATAAFFPADLAGSVAAVALHAARRPYRWHNPRERGDGGR